MKSKRNKNKRQRQQAVMLGGLVGLLLLSAIPDNDKVGAEPTVREGGRKRLWLIFLFLILLAAGGAMACSAMQLSRSRAAVSAPPPALVAEFNALTDKMGRFNDAEATHSIKIVSDSDMRNRLSAVQNEVSSGQYVIAARDTAALSRQVDQWQKTLDARLAEASSTAKAKTSVEIPILLYHYTPANFEKQLQWLQTHGYSAIDFRQAASAIQGQDGLPNKPVIITYDDGFENQMTAFNLLMKYKMKATFYIINGGAASNYCIGAGRRFNQVKSCGDAYLTWGQVRQLDASGLVTIGGHTLDHINLPTKSADIQRQEIVASKQDIEKEIGHPIYDFAYPYGAFNATTIELVRTAGYLDAVTTLPGTYQTIGQPYTLRRIRDALVLP